jgi:hypothetical protein
MGNVAEQPRVKLLADYMARHEKILERSLAKFEEGASRGVLNTWFKNAPSVATGKCFEGVEIKPDMNIEDVIRIALKLDDCLLELYRSMADAAMAKDVKELFDQLLKAEMREERLTVRSALEMEQA